jgi:CRISPR/Cas system-associated exonuclease Cas4 (RecB family)
LVVPLVAILIAGLVVITAWALYRTAHPRLRGTKVRAVDLAEGRWTRSVGVPVGRVPTMTSARYGLTGRPDELRETSDGRVFPVEIKSGRPAPEGHAHASHEIQVLVYCLLLEEDGTPPPYGLLVYGDGAEIQVPWNAAGRRRVLAALAEVQRPYRGAMSPAYPKCVRCPYRGSCEGAIAVGVRRTQL